MKRFRFSWGPVTGTTRESILKIPVKKNIAGILIAAAFLTLACLCCPTNIIPYIKMDTPVTPLPDPTLAPGPTTIPATRPTTVVTSLDIAPMCVQDLEQVLNESESMLSSDEDLQLDDEYSLVTYTVDGDTLRDPVYDSIPANLETYQQDNDSHASVWDFIVTVIPADWRTMIASFNVYTDGVSGSLGAVEQTDDPSYWDLELDIVDSSNFPGLATTVIHEFAHLLTLNDSQVTIDYDIFYNFDDQDVYDQAVADCPNYFTFEGCSQSDSYINQFFQSYWTGLYDEWLTINAETNTDRLDQKLSNFYGKHASQFVSEYAVTDPSEDIAESFMYFIFVARPSGTAIADQKILFFYTYPELVTLRERILSNLCTYVP